MPHYRTDLDDSGKPIDVIEFQARHPDKVLPPDPRILVDLMRRDLWTRGEALLVIAGFPPSNDVGSAGGAPFILGNLGVGCDYLDGTNDVLLKQVGIQHPLKNTLQDNYRTLRGYSQGQPLDESKSPQEWLSWAEEKGFKPYWLDYWREHGSDHPSVLERATLAAYRAQYQRQESEKKANGRYTLEEAAKNIARNTGERAMDLQAKLMQAVTEGLLPVYRPGEKQTYSPETVREFYEEAHWDDLNAWLEKCEPRLSWRFPAPGQANAERQGTPCGKNTKPDHEDNLEDADNGVTRREQQIRAIEKAADELGYSHLKIPDGGKKCLMEKCKRERSDLFGYGDNPFKDAWKEAVKQGRLRMKNHDKYSPKIVGHKNPTSIHLQPD